MGELKAGDKAYSARERISQLEELYGRKNMHPLAQLTANQAQ